jgi:vanillate O-demethylase monooxygenase subunit
MGVLDHWHPVLPARDLRHRPVAGRSHGTDVVLFRTPGQIGALEDRCPHRRMRLSLGRVTNGRPRCSYHGWTFDCRGAGQSPGTPRLHAAARTFHALEHLGVIRVKSARATPELPRFPNPRPGAVGR